MRVKKWKPIFNHYQETDTTVLKEGAVSPKYYEEVENYLLRLKDKVNKLKYDNVFKLCRWLTVNLRKYSIKFLEDKQEGTKTSQHEFQAGINRSGCLSNKKGTINIYCNENILKIQNNDKYYNFFVKNVIRVIGHELIHRNQGFVINNQELRNLIFKDPEKVEDYLRKKQEVMARAWQIIEEFRYSGLNDKQILDILRKNKDTRLVAYSSTLMEYLDIFDVKDPVFKDLYKYAYLYITNQEVR